MEHLDTSTIDSLRPYSLNELGVVAGLLPGKWRDDTITTEAFARIANGIERFRKEYGPVRTLCVDYNSGHFPGVFVDAYLAHAQGEQVPHTDLALTRNMDTETEDVRRNTLTRLLTEERLVPPILLVTDFVERGNTLSMVADELARRGLAFAVCSVGVSEQKNAPSTNRAKIDNYLIIGSYGKYPAVTHFLHRTRGFLETRPGRAFPRIENTATPEQQDAFAAMTILGEELATRRIRQ